MDAVKSLDVAKKAALARFKELKRDPKDASADPDFRRLLGQEVSLVLKPMKKETPDWLLEPVLIAAGESAAELWSRTENLKKSGAKVASTK